MPTNLDAGSAIISVLTSLVACSVTYGVLKTKVERLERDVSEHEQRDQAEHKYFVTKDLFDAVIIQVREDLADLKSDMKELLALFHDRKV